MTYIHSEQAQKNILNFVLGGLIFTSLVGVFFLVALYNKTVDLSHTIAAEKAQVDSVGAQNTTLNSQVAAALGGVSSDDLASADGLVEDNNPQYFPVPSNQDGISLRNSN